MMKEEIYPPSSVANAPNCLQFSSPKEPLIKYLNNRAGCGIIGIRKRRGRKAMEKQINFADIEYGNRGRKTKREEFPEKMESVIPWGKWVEIIEPY